MTSIAIDSQLLLLLVVGSASREFVAHHRRLRNYTVEDFDLLSELLSRTNAIVVTPHVLAETSNLSRQIGEPARSQIGFKLTELVGWANEVARPAIQLVHDQHFIKLGLTDAALLSIAVPDCTLLTADFDLWGAARSRGLPVQNFVHLREQAGLL